MSEKIAYRMPEASEVSGIGRTTLYREIAAGRLESVLVGRRRLIPAVSLRNYIERLRAEANAAEAE
jgi:excisionase family DNA binding protein